MIDLEISDFYEQINYAFEKHTEDILLQRWISNYEKSMSFEEFKSNLTVKSNKYVAHKDTKEVLEDVNNIINLFLQERR